MTVCSDRSTVAPPAPVLAPPARLRSPAHNAIPVRYRIRLPKGGHRAPRKGDIQRCCLHHDADTGATDPVSVNQTPIAPHH